MLMDLRLFRRLLPLVLLLVTTPLPAHVEPSGDAAIELEECRFLSPSRGEDETRTPLPPERVSALYDVLRGTQVGTLVVSAIERFRARGVGSSGSHLRLVEVRRDGGPAAEYFESGELAVSASLFEGSGGDTPEARGRLYTAASFVVHEAVHAIAHHLFLEGRFAPYNSETKVNEALASFIQGLYLEEIRERDPDYLEPDTVPSWDRCTAHIVRILRQYGITPESGFDETYDHLAELQLEADEVTAQMLAKLWQYFQFIHGSGEAAELWKLGEQSPPRFRVVERLTTMIARDVEQRRCNLDETFAFMTNRIILYGHYPDTPPDTTACQYFGDFLRAVRVEEEVTDFLREQIDRWLARRGLSAKTPRASK